jgi:threonine dehydratase
METLWLTPSTSSSLHHLLAKRYTSPSTSISPLIVRNKQCRATLTNPAAVTSFKPSTQPSPFKTTPPHHDQPHELKKVLPETLEYESGFLGCVPEKFAGDDRNGIHETTMMSYLTRILTSKVYDVAIESPLDYASKLSGKLDVHLWLKREDLQPVSSLSPSSF